MPHAYSSLSGTPSVTDDHDDVESIFEDGVDADRSSQGTSLHTLEQENEEVEDEKWSTEWVCPLESCHHVLSKGNASSIKRHEITHWPREAWPHACTWPGCDYRAPQKTAVTIHMKTHDPKNNLEHCRFFDNDGKPCQFSYIDPPNYTRHKQTVHGVPRRERKRARNTRTIGGEDDIWLRVDGADVGGYKGYYTFPPVSGHGVRPSYCLQNLSPNRDEPNSNLSVSSTSV